MTSRLLTNIQIQLNLVSFFDQTTCLFFIALVAPIPVWSWSFGAIM